MYKLFEFALPSITEAENLFLILRKLIFLKINILSCILHNTVEGSGVEISGGREGAGITAPRQTCLSASSVTAPRQTQDVDTELA